MADEDAEVVQEGRGEDDIVVIGGGGTDEGGDLPGECVEPGLVAVLVGRGCLALQAGIELGAEAHAPRTWGFACGPKKRSICWPRDIRAGMRAAS